MPSLESEFDGPFDDDDPTITFPTDVFDHITRARDRLPQQFKNKPNIDTYLQIVLEPYQELESIFAQLIRYRDISSAVGEQLDVLGRVVGQLREGRADADYRRFIRARVAANRSRGTLDDLVLISHLVLAEGERVQAATSGTASAVVWIRDVAVSGALADILITFLRRAKSAGVRLNLETEPTANTTSFDDSAHGFDDDSSMAEARS